MQLVMAFVLINTHPGSEESVNAALKSVDGVAEIYTLFGEYDIIIKVVSNDYSNLEHIMVEKIRTIDGIIDTKTLVVIKL